MDCPPSSAFDLLPAKYNAKIAAVVAAIVTAAIGRLFGLELMSEKGTKDIDSEYSGW